MWCMVVIRVDVVTRCAQYYVDLPSPIHLCCLAHSIVKGYTTIVCFPTIVTITVLPCIVFYWSVNLTLTTARFFSSLHILFCKKAPDKFEDYFMTGTPQSLWKNSHPRCHRKKILETSPQLSGPQGRPPWTFLSHHILVGSQLGLKIINEHKKKNAILSLIFIMW